MRGIAPGNSTPYLDRTPRPSDVTHEEKRNNRLRALSAREASRPYILRGEFKDGKPTYERNLSEDEARLLVDGKVAWQCAECGDAYLHLWAGKYRADVEQTIGSSAV